jgi:hypothetical protein
MTLQADYIKMLMEHGIEAEALDYSTFLAALVGHAKAAYAAGLSLTQVCGCGHNFIALAMRWRGYSGACYFHSVRWSWQWFQNGLMCKHRCPTLMRVISQGADTDQ